MVAGDAIAWSIVDKFLSDSGLWSSKSFVAKPDRLLGWTEEELDLAPADSDDPILLRQRVRRWANLSRLADVVPNGKRMTLDGNLLSGLARQILSHGECATGIVLSKTEKEKFERARNILFEPDSNGLMQASEKSRKYSIYKSKYYAAEQALRTADLQVKDSGDVALVHQFHEIERPELVAAIATAQLEWLNLGFKNEVEAAKANQIAYAERAPSEVWSRFRDQFLMAELKDLEGWGFYPIRTTPNRIADLIWQPATVQVPLDVKHMPSVMPSVDFDRVEFEYAFLRVDRGWLDSSNSVLNSRIWRHRDYQSGSISDGKSPPSGICPGFAIGFILVRSLKVYSSYAITNISNGNEVLVPSGFKEYMFKESSNGGFVSAKGALAGLMSATNMSANGGFNDLTLGKHPADFLGGDVNIDFPTEPTLDNDFSDLVIDARLPQTKKTVAFDDRIWDAKDFPPRYSGGLTPQPDVSPPMDASLDELIKRLKLQLPDWKSAMSPTKPKIKVVVSKAESVRVLLPESRVVLGGILCKSLPSMPNPDSSLTWE